MEKRTLGRTGLEVSVLGMGGLYVSRAGDRGRDEGCRAVHRALELGVNYVDTAPSYRDSEEVLGIALEDVKQPYFLATKLGGRLILKIKISCGSRSMKAFGYSNAIISISC